MCSINAYINILFNFIGYNTIKLLVSLTQLIDINIYMNFVSYQVIKNIHIRLFLH